jgi:hypothetical protein
VVEGSSTAKNLIASSILNSFGRSGLPFFAIIRARILLVPLPSRPRYPLPDSRFPMLSFVSVQASLLLIRHGHFRSRLRSFQRALTTLLCPFSIIPSPAHCSLVLFLPGQVLDCLLPMIPCFT